MNLKEKNKIIKLANSLNDEDLEKLYYESVFDCLGSQVDDMYDLCYDICDIKEREKYEKYMLERSNILEHCCLNRNIELFKDYYNYHNEPICDDNDIPY